MDDYEDMQEFVDGIPSYLKVIEGDQGAQQQNVYNCIDFLCLVIIINFLFSQPEHIQYYAQTTLAETLKLEKSKRAARKAQIKAQMKEDDKEEYYYVETMRPPQPLPVSSTADDSDEDAYETFCPPSQETITSPTYPPRQSMYSTDTTSLPSPTSLNPPAVPLRRSSDRATPPSFSHPTHEGAYINQNRRSSGTPDSYPTISPVHSTPNEGPDTLPRTSSIRPDSASPLEPPNNRNSEIFTYSHKETPPPVVPRTITSPHHFPRTSTHDPMTPSKPPIAPKPTPKPRIGPKPIDRH